MNPVLIAQLLATFGPPAVKIIDSLIVKIEKGGDVSSAEWQDIRNNALQTSKDRMLLQLQAAGIDPASDQGKAFLAAAA